MKYFKYLESVFDTIRANATLKQEFEEEVEANPFTKLGVLWELHTIVAVTKNQIVIEYRATDVTVVNGQGWNYHPTATVMIIYKDYDMPAYYEVILTRKITANYQLKSPGSIHNPHLQLMGIKRKTKCDTIHEVRNKMEVFYDKFWEDQNNVDELITKAIEE